MKRKSIEEMIQDLDYKVKNGNLNDRQYQKLKNQIHKEIIRESDLDKITKEEEKRYMNRIGLLDQVRTGQSLQQVGSSSIDVVVPNYEEANPEISVAEEELEEVPEPKNVNKSWFKKHKRNVVILSSLVVGVITIGGLSVAKYAKEAKAEEIDKTTNSVDNGNYMIQNGTIVLGEITKQVDDFNNQLQEASNYVKVNNMSLISSTLSENLAFDINDNEELIERASQFITQCRPCGVDMSEPESISKFMDYIHTLNYEQIDPMDYARYGYFTKTSNSIVDNYQEIGNPLVYDLFSVTTETLIPYDLIIADKESAKVIMDLQTLVAQYNEADKKGKSDIQKEIETFLYDNFVSDDARTFGSTVYEIVGRFGIIIDQMLPSGLPKDTMNKLSNDLYSCGIKIPEGEQIKSERAQNETSIRTTLEEKLLYALNCRVQDLTVLPEIELLNGAEVEKKIAERVVELNLPFVENPEAKEAKTTTILMQSAKSVTLSNGQQISENDVKSLGLNPDTVTPEEYENAKRQQFEEAAKADSSHTYTTVGGVTTSGNAVENSINLTAQGTSDGYSDGLNNLYNPKSNDPSYLSGYSTGNALGVADRVQLEESLKQQEETTFVPSTEQPVVSETEQITEQPAQNTAETPITSPSESSTTFVPIEGEIVEEITGETVEESGYVEEVTYSDSIALHNTASDIQTQIANLMLAREMLVGSNTNEYDLSGYTYTMKI